MHNNNRHNRSGWIVLSMLCLGLALAAGTGCVSPLDVNTPFIAVGHISPVSVRIANWELIDSSGQQFRSQMSVDITPNSPRAVELDTGSTPGTLWLHSEISPPQLPVSAAVQLLSSIELNVDAIRADGEWVNLTGQQATLTLSSLTGTSVATVRAQADGVHNILRIRSFHIPDNRTFLVNIEGSITPPNTTGARPATIRAEITILY